MKHVLLIDDNVIDCHITKHVISRSNMADKISVLNSAVEALEYLKPLKNDMEEFPDYIFLDIQMPEINGFGFLERFKKFPEKLLNHCRVIMLTSSNDQKDIERSFQYACVKKFITKPLTHAALEAVPG